ncbi:MAG: lysophospholipid acyltransferase family protein [Acidobacteria bacterium]|nr:lysophospholipid acyltransferase family protein [Acidobacteriota bacterium]
MRRLIRASRRLVLFTGVGAVYYLGWWIGRIAMGRSSRLRTCWRQWIFRTWSSTLLRVLGIRVTVSGPPPANPFYLVSNHLSYLDVVILASRLKAVFVAKSEVSGWPVLGPICRSMDTIFIDRAARRDITRVLDATSEALARGDGVVLFPEGTSTPGAEVLPFQASLLATPARLGQPVNFASVSYSTPPGEPPAHLAVCWWGDMAFPDHFWTLLGLSRIDAKLAFGEDRIADESRKVLAARLHQAVSSTFTPVVELTEE